MHPQAEMAYTLPTRQSLFHFSHRGIWLPWILLVFLPVFANLINSLCYADLLFSVASLRSWQMQAKLKT